MRLGGSSTSRASEFLVHAVILFQSLLCSSIGMIYLRHALKQTKEHAVGFLSTAVCGAIGLAVLYYWKGEQSALEELGSLATTLIGLLAGAVLFFLWKIISAPYAIANRRAISAEHQVSALSEELRQIKAQNQDVARHLTDEQKARLRRGVSDVSFPRKVEIIVAGNALDGSDFAVDIAEAFTRGSIEISSGAPFWPAQLAERGITLFYDDLPELDDAARALERAFLDAGVFLKLKPGAVKNCGPYVIHVGKHERRN